LKSRYMIIVVSKTTEKEMLNHLLIVGFPANFPLLMRYAPIMIKITEASKPKFRATCVASLESRIVEKMRIVVRMRVILA